ERRPDTLHAPVLAERARGRGAEDRPSAVVDTLDPVAVELHGNVVHHPAPAVPEPQDLVPVRGGSLPHHGADGGIEAGAVSASGEHADPPHPSSPRSFKPQDFRAIVVATLSGASEEETG